jgi:hypothetical protein
MANDVKNADMASEKRSNIRYCQKNTALKHYRSSGYVLENFSAKGWNAKKS